MTIKSTTKSLASSGLAAAPPNSGRQQRRVNRTRHTLMQAARAVFSEKGLDLTTIEDITKRADVGKGTFYYHFPNKEELIRELTRNLLAELVGAIKSEVNSSTKLERTLECIIQAHINFFKRRWEDYVIYFRSRADLAIGERREGIESPFVDYLGCIEQLVDAAIQQRAAPTNLRRIACAIAGFVSGYYSFALIDMNGDQIEKSVRTMRSSLVAGMTKFVREATS